MPQELPRALVFKSLTSGEAQSAWKMSGMYKEDRKCRYLAQETRPKSDENVPDWPGVERGA